MPKKKIGRTPQKRYYTVNGKRRLCEVWKDESGRVHRRIVSKKNKDVGRQSGHGSLGKNNRYRRSDKSGTSMYSRKRDVKVHAKHKAAPNRPFEGDTKKVYYEETKNGKVRRISSDKSKLRKPKGGKIKVGYI